MPLIKLKTFMAKSLVLYADDDPDDRQILADAFNFYSKKVDLRLFRDGIELIRFLNTEEKKPCLVILDMNMPMLDGKDTLRLLRTRDEFENTPVVLFTTSSLPADSYFAKHYNAGFITKPLDLEQMSIIVDQFLEYCTDEVKMQIKSV